MHQSLMHGSTLTDGGCTVDEPPYKEEDLVAEKSHLGLVNCKA